MFGRFRSVTKFWISAALVVALTPAVGRASPVAVYNAVNDFSITSNPNGAWSYGWTSTLGGPINLYRITSTDFISGVDAG